MRQAAAARALVAAALLLAIAASPPRAEAAEAEKAEGAFRVAVFNVSLARGRAGALIDELRQAPAARASAQIAQGMDVLRSVRPDAVLLLELDYDPAGEALALYERELAQPSAAGPGLVYAHRFQAPVNAGLPSGFDLDGDGERRGPADAQGWGVFEGQFGMALLSAAPIDVAASRTFAALLWSAAPNAAPPRRVDGEPYYAAEAWAALRLSSKSHWDVALQVPSATGAARALHLLASHPTPPVFDGPEDRNGLRNAAEIEFWRDYVEGGAAAAWIADDQGRAGGLADGASFVLLGDLNLDPEDGQGRREAVRALLTHPRLRDPAPESAGAAAASARQGGVNAAHRGPAARDTAEWRDEPPRGPGNLRVDYALPSSDLTVLGAGVFWPAPDEPGGGLMGALLQEGRRWDAGASDHRLVWVDLDLSVASQSD